ncbi:protein CEPU-1 isoform X2 [Bactrocera oleae]|uniref:protein CEPU-1 isoform X2 n=1 Tax=Bactrocera oleae TaxID=104688 RepID=UPI0017498ECA|nr:V-set and immunoglobulin domain-containing protein 10 isoform X1 [Bactrocera oleae]
MLLEYVMMLLVFGLTTTVERSHSNAFAFEVITRHPTHQHRLSPPNALTSTAHHLQQHHLDSVTLAGRLTASSLASSTSPVLASLSQHELSNVIVDSFEGVGGTGGGGGGEPQFENTTEREVIAAVGTTARLHCRVRNLGDRAVSWIRKRDLHILTIGIMTYTNDQRFLARHTDNSDEWVLKVVSVQPRDAGVYECQVSTEPKISQAYKLMVVTSKAQILSNRELYIQSGSDINLTCIAPQAPGPYTHMMWYKDSELINDSTRGGIRVVSEQQMKTSNLVISRVLHRDSGNYTCAADNSNSDSVLVHIIKSEQHAAMQHELATRMQTPRLMLVLLAFFYVS